MRALLTGARGTVGRALRARLEACGHEVAAWDRSAVPIDDYAKMDAFVRSAHVDVVYNLAIASDPTGREGESWLVNYEWASELAWICRMQGLRFVHASTAMVFSDRAVGPFSPTSVADATSGYGYEKRMAEHRVLSQYPAATIARLGWQIGDVPGANTMVEALDREMRDTGAVQASVRFWPACSFLEDTAEVLERLASAEPGTYMLDSNEGWNHFELASSLAAHFGRRWRVLPVEGFSQDQRMRDDRVSMPSLRVRLRDLRAP